MLGLAVTTVAIMGTVLMGFALSAETETVQYDDWGYLSNVSGMFETDKTPQYVPYSPAANWTGFSIYKDHRDTSGISYTTSPNSNLYPIKQEQTKITYSTTISDVNMPSPPTSSALLKSWGVVFNSTDTYKPIYGENGSNVTCNKPTVITLKTAYDSLGGSGFDQITISTGGSSNPIWSMASDWTESTWRYNTGGYVQTYNVWTLNTDYPSTSIPSGTITITTATMSATFTPAGGTPQALGNLEDIYLVYGGSGTGDGQYIIGSTIQGSKLTDVTPIYMDTSQGVSLGDRLVYWSNGYDVSKMSVLFHSPTTSGYYSFTIWFPDAGSDSLSGNHLMMEYKNGQMYIAVGHGNGPVTSVNMVVGGWRNAIITLDLIGKVVTVNPIIKYTSMNNYTLSDNIMTLDWSGIGSNATAAKDFIFNRTEIDVVTPLFGVISTDVFMDTYGVVMKDPSIAPFDLYPQLNTSGTTLRVDFRSFALYGRSIMFGPVTSSGNWYGFAVNDGLVSVGGKSYNLVDGMTVDITRVSSGYDIQIMIGGEEVTTYTGYWGDGIQFNGNWYMETEIYQGVIKSKDVTKFTFDKFVFDSNAAIMCYLGLLVLGISVGARYAGASWTDMIIVLFAGICGFILMTVG